MFQINALPQCTINDLPVISCGRYCDMNDYPCVVYDHECSGQSRGDVQKVTFTSWVEDALRVTSELTEGPLVLVGSSTGGWLSIITALKLKERLHGLGRFFSNSHYIVIKIKHFFISCIRGESQDKIKKRG